MDMGKHSDKKRTGTTINVSDENHDWLSGLIQEKGDSFDDIITRIRTKGYTPS